MKNNQVFYDPVHKIITFKSEDKLLLDLVNSCEFKRLHLIKQLGHVYLVYPGCLHSRYLHMLGAYHLARQLTDYHLTTVFNVYERKLFLAAALLHDLGHGPFSHTFEYVFGWNHEKLTHALILNNDLKINKILQKFNANFANDLVNVFHNTYPNKLLKKLLSSQLDVDRLDYLLRDSWFSGVNYANFELNWILKSINIIDQTPVFNYSARFAIEQYIMARYYMYNLVYTHPRAFIKEVLMKRIFQRYQELEKENFSWKHNYRILNVLFEHSKDNPSTAFLNDYLSLNDQILQSWIKDLGEEKDHYLQYLVKMYFNKIPLYYYETYNKEKADGLIKKLNSEEKLFLNGENSLFHSNSIKLAPYQQFQKNEEQIKMYNEDNKIVTLQDLLYNKHELYFKQTVKYLFFSSVRIKNFKSEQN